MKEKRKKTKAKTKPNQIKKEKNKQGGGGDISNSESVRAKSFLCAFSLDFLQLTCKASLIFKSNLELALSIILK